MEDYTIWETLGEGSFSVVKLAFEKRNGKSVAIKEINRGKESAVKHLQQEIEALRKLKHPNIIRFIKLIPTRTHLYSVMEYAAGGNLSEKLTQKGKLEEPVARKLFQQLISAVEYSHSQNVYHRDLKPLNLVLDEEENLKVCDFGAAYLGDEDQHFILTTTHCGTLHYLAPEILAKHPYDPSKVDIWSCGVILFILLAGYHPFHDPKAHINKENHTSARSFLSSLLQVGTIANADFRFPPWFSPGACKLLSKILVVDPLARITIPEILEDEWFKLDYCPPKHTDEEHCTSPCNSPVSNAVNLLSKDEQFISLPLGLPDGGMHLNSNGTHTCSIPNGEIKIDTNSWYDGRGWVEHITSFLYKVVQICCNH